MVCLERFETKVRKAVFCATSMIQLAVTAFGLASFVPYCKGVIFARLVTAVHTRARVFRISTTLTILRQLQMGIF